MKSLLVALWEKIFPKKKSKPEYRFQYMDDSDLTWVEITSGKYVGVVYSYSTVKFAKEGEFGRLSFGYNVLHSAEHDLIGLQSDEEFVTIMGDILTDIIIHQESQNEQTRTLDSEEPHL